MHLHFGDTTNAAFLLVGAIGQWSNVRRILRDKCIHGVVWWYTLVFTGWCIFDLYYYPSLGQWLSFVGGLLMGSANVTWAILAVYYTYLRRA